MAGGSIYFEEDRTGEQAGTEEWFLCSLAGGRPFHLADTGGTEGGVEFARLVFDGEQAALAWGLFDAIEKLEVIDLATDRAVFTQALPSNAAHPRSSQVGRIVLKRDDAVAWTELVPSGAYEVIEHTSRGTKVLDDTHTTQPYSLKLVGSTLRWLEHDGEARTATLH